ncbi:MAG: amidase, partial [Xanthomonadales bacterium]|nr:amidase [Xanthomonadales bacterium]
PDGERADWLPLAEVTDRTDGKLAHLDGLHLSRAWMLDGVLHGLPEDDPRRAPLAISRDLHREAGLASVTGEYYEGGHWLGSFATYLVTRRGLATDAPDLEIERARTSVAMVDHARRRVRTADAQLRSVIALSPEARDRAAALDAEALAGQRRGPLHGVPVLIKDNIETGELPTTAGSLALKDNRTGRDAPLISNLREAGLVILGKANLSEWANFRDNESSSGWSAVGGQARNPWDTDRSPCGSSSGSAVAVAAGLVPLAVGTETNGSIICPAAVNGIVGVKPTVGLVSRAGVVPIAHSQDTAGPMAMNVTGAALLLGAMEGHDPNDPATDLAREHLGRDYATQLRADGLRGMRVGVVRSQSFHEGVDRVFEQAVADLGRAGAEVVDELRFPEWPEGFWDDALDVLLYEFRHDLNRYLAGLPGESGELTLARLIEFNRAHADTEMPWFGQDLFERAEATGEDGGLDAERYRQALEQVQGFTRDTLNTLMSEHELDLLVMPSNAPAWTIDWVNGDHFIGGSSSMAAISGYPHVTVPMGRWKGLPVGLSFIGRAFAEPILLRAAYAYEQATRHARTPDGFTPWPWPVPLAAPPANSQDAGQQGLPFGRVAGEGLVVPALVGQGARCEVAEGEQGEREACG